MMGGGGRRRRIKDISCIVALLLKNKGRSLPYPLYKVYSDFLVLSGEDIKKLIEYFGVFAAMGLFVEVAIPTAMALVCKDIVTESMIGKRGVEMWGQKSRNQFAEDNNYEIDRLFKMFPQEVIYYHPVKLSKWKL